MRHWRKPARLAVGALWLALSCSVAMAAAPCDEFDPAGPVGTTRITLGSGDLVDQVGDELRSFVETDSIGRVDVAVVSANPRSAVLGVSAVPGISRVSPYYLEELKGIAVVVAVAPGRRPAHVVLDLRQVCAKRFRNTFLYY